MDHLTQETIRMAKKRRSELQEQASRGGKARAKSMTAEERSENARLAVEARWTRQGKTPTPRAAYGSSDRPLRIGEIELPCYVLEDGTRVFSQRGLQSGLEMGVGGGANRMAKFANDIDVSGSKFNSLAARIRNPIKFIPPHGGPTASGYEATILVDLCDAVLQARKDKTLPSGLGPIADRCEILVRAFAKVGIIALIDEATGFQYERQRDALEELLEEFLSAELRKWVKTFPASYFRELCRIRHVAYRGDMKLPQYFGHLTNDVVYSRLAPKVLEALKELNPSKNSRREHKHFQWLSEGLGHPKLLQHLGTVIGLMKISDDWDTFKKHLDVAAPLYEDCPSLASLDDD